MKPQSKGNEGEMSDGDVMMGTRRGAEIRRCGKVPLLSHGWVKSVKYECIRSLVILRSSITVLSLHCELNIEVS